MTNKIIELDKYRAKIEELKKEAEKEKEANKQAMMEAIFDWLDMKLEEYDKSYEESENVFDKLDRIRPDYGELLSTDWPEKEKEEILAHFELVGRLDYILEAVKALQNEGATWRDTIPKKNRKE